MSVNKKYKKNEEYEVVITDIGMNGEGIGHLEDGYTLFVVGAVPGDRVIAHIVKPSKSYAHAKMVKIIQASEDRIVPECMVANKCGGCQISALSYEAQLRIKEKKVRELFTRVGGFEKEYVDKIFNHIEGYPEKPVHFRNKAQYPIGMDREGNIITGFYTTHSHRIIPNNDCIIGAESDASILNCIKDYMKEYHVPPYDEIRHDGLMRHVLIRTGYYTHEIMVCLVINGKTIPEKKSLINSLLSTELGEYQITSICVSSNTLDTNVIMGDSYEVIYGNGYITDKIGDISFRISPLSFFQVNPVQTQKLYSLALEAAELCGGETVWDLYCGIGTISLFLAQKAKHVYGIEIVPQAIMNAKENALLNNMENVDFFVGKAEEVLPDFYNNCLDNDSAIHPDVIVVDPPRKGCDDVCLQTMMQMKPKRIVYVSCDPATLSRDAKILTNDGKYELASITPVDMFPNSIHVETVCKFIRK